MAGEASLSHAGQHSGTPRASCAFAVTSPPPIQVDRLRNARGLPSADEACFPSDVDVNSPPMSTRDPPKSIIRKRTARLQASLRVRRRFAAWTHAIRFR